jgi:hypothetical protein
MKTSDLTGPQLDWAVAKCEGIDLFETDGWVYDDEGRRPYKPSTDWSQGGPLLERERLSLTYDAHWHYDPTDPEDNGERWYCELTEPNEGSSHGMYGPTPLVAAMRTLVSSRLGPEIEIPQELV